MDHLQAQIAIQLPVTLRVLHRVEEQEAALVDLGRFDFWTVSDGGIPESFIDSAVVVSLK